jgi:hypothetical protein
MKTLLAVTLALLAQNPPLDAGIPAEPPDAGQADAGAPPPPSTGKELPRAPAPKLPTQAQAKQAWGLLLAKAKAPDRDCARLISPYTRLMFSIANPSDEEIRAQMDSYLWMARCAEKQKYYVLLGDLGDLMWGADPKRGHPELLARAYMGLNSPKSALKILQTAEKLDGKNADVAVTAAKVQCRVRDWAECLKAADKAIKLAAALKGDEKNQILNRGHKYRARALLHKGQLKDVEKAVALSEKLGGDEADLRELREAIVPARTFQAVVEAELQDDVALGIYHLIGKREGSRPLARLYVSNVGADRQFRAECQIDGVTSNQSKTVTLLRGKEAVIDLIPPLSPSFDAASLRSARKAQLNLKLVAVGEKGEQTVLSQSHELELQPRDFLPTSAYVDEEKALGENLFIYMGAWVTPNAKAIDAFLGAAKQKSPRNTFAGEQAATLPQVKALYDTLKEKGVSYVMDPDILAGAAKGQRTRLPSEVLTSTNAQCLEGAILYATLMEAIGLRPGIVIVPGHAFVAWYPTPSDGDDVKGQVLFLETTMTHDATFEDAVKVARAEFLEASARKKARVLFLPDLRKQGITPQPFD